MKFCIKHQALSRLKGQIAENVAESYISTVLIPRLKRKGWNKVLFYPQLMPSVNTWEEGRDEIMIPGGIPAHLNHFVRKLPEEYKIFPNPEHSRYILVIDRSKQSTLIYSWETVNPITPRKSTRLINKSHYKRLRIDQKILLAKEFSKETKKLAGTVENLALVEVDPSKCQAEVEGEIEDGLLLSLLLKELHSPPRFVAGERVWRRSGQVLDNGKEIRIVMLREGIYPSRELSGRYESMKELLEHCPDGFLLKLRKTGEVKRAKEIVSEIGIAEWSLLDRESGLAFSDKDVDESVEVPIYSGEIEIVEVKSGKGRLTKAQRDEYSNLVKTGFPLRLIRVTIVSFAKNHFEVEDKLLRTPPAQ